MDGPTGAANWECIDLNFSGKGSAKWGHDKAMPEMAETFELMTG